MAESLRRLRISEAELRSILESAPDLVISYNRNIEVLYFNEAARIAFRNLLGVELRTGLRTYDVFPPEQRAYWDSVNARVLSGQRFTEEFRTTAPDGEPVVYETSYQPVWDGDSVIGFSTFGRNVSAQRRQEEALRQALKRESLGVLGGGVAHDFNNLLAVMLGNLERMRRSGNAGELTGHFLDDLQEAVQRGADLTRQMLAYAGRGTTDVRPQHLDEILRGMAKLLSVNISKKVSLRLALSDGELPMILVDRGQIAQAVMNLVTNAAEALGDAPGEIRVATAAVEIRSDEPGTTLPGYEPSPGPRVLLEVGDTGPGIAPEVLERIFDPFFTTKTHGRGLGLSSLLRSLRGHGAGLRVLTAPGKGATFRLYFPAAPRPLPKPAGAQAAPPEPERSGTD